jgi:hypothetical protein
MVAEEKAIPGDGEGWFEPPIIVWRNRIPKSDIPLRTVLAETDFRPGDAVANEETGYYVVGPETSVIFLSKAFDDSGRRFLSRKWLLYLRTLHAGQEIIVVELVVIRKVACRAPFSVQLYAWLSEVVAAACSERRNVRVRINKPGISSLILYSC